MEPSSIAQDFGPLAAQFSSLHRLLCNSGCAYLTHHSPPELVAICTQSHHFRFRLRACHPSSSLILSAPSSNAFYRNLGCLVALTPLLVGVRQPSACRASTYLTDKRLRVWRLNHLFFKLATHHFFGGFGSTAQRILLRFGFCDTNRSPNQSVLLIFRASGWPAIISY